MKNDSPALCGHCGQFSPINPSELSLEEYQHQLLSIKKALDAQLEALSRTVSAGPCPDRALRTDAIARIQRLVQTAVAESLAETFEQVGHSTEEQTCLA